MKKILLLNVILAMALSGHAQEQEARKSHEVVAPIYSNPVTTEDELPSTPDPSQAGGEAQGLDDFIPAAGFIDTSLIGGTSYDLQSNAAIGRRVINHGNGELSVVWTTSTALANDAFPDRGTGYNFYDGSQWVNGVVEQRLEQDARTGWPSIGAYDGSEYVIAHSPNEIDNANPSQLGDERGGFFLSENSFIGQSSWNQTDWLSLSRKYNPGQQQDGAKGPIWYRTDNTGKLVHMISAYSDTGFYAENRDKDGDSIRRPMVYSRFDLESDSFEVAEKYLVGYGERHFAGDPDAYAIDARDSVVAIVSGGVFSDVTLWRSSDSGQTFTRTIIDTFPAIRRQRIDTVTFDEHQGNDGNVNVLLDNNLDAHVFWGSVTRLDDEADEDGTFSVRRNTVSIFYWNDVQIGTRLDTTGFELDTIPVGENEKIDTIFSIDTVPRFDPKRSIVGFDDFDIINPDQNNLEVGEGTFDLTNGGGRYSQSTLISFPQAGVDSDNHLYLTYSQVMEGGPAVQSNGQNYRDLFAIYSTDSGRSWSSPTNLTNSPLTEEVYNSVATLVDDHIHMVFMSDDEPGTNLTNGDQVRFNDIIYARINTDSLKAGANPVNPVGITPRDKVNQLNAFSVYPNPMQARARIRIDAATSSEAQLSIVDITGREVRRKTLQLNQGVNQFEIERASLESGVYMIQVAARGTQLNQRLILR